ncbi:hypothetical protein ABK040_002282 [Willaertia magna]
MSNKQLPFENKGFEREASNSCATSSNSFVGYENKKTVRNRKRNKSSSQQFLTNTTTSKLPFKTTVEKDPEADISTEDEKDNEYNKKQFLLVHDYVMSKQISNGSKLITKKDVGTIFYNTKSGEYWIKWFNGKKFILNATLNGFLTYNQTSLLELTVEAGKEGEGEALAYERSMKPGVRASKQRRKNMQKRRLMAEQQKIKEKE